jgi:hypothetical protein
MIKWIYKPSGNVPVQAEGYFMGHYFYFRARWRRATIDFAKTQADWERDLCTARYTLLTVDDDYSAGWLPKWICRLLIWWGCFRFLIKRGKNRPVPLV